MAENLLSLASAMTQPEPENRPESMALVREALREIARGGQAENRPTGDRSAEATQPPTLVRPPLKLTPPPRLQTRRPSAAPHPGSATGGGTSNPKPGVLTAIAFAVLVLAVAGVFFLLPKWVDQRETSKAERSTETTASASPPSAPSESAAAQTEPSPVTPATVEPPAVEQQEIQRSTPERKEASPGYERTTVLAAPSSRPAAPSQGFSNLMSEGLAALDRQDYTAATDAFQRAQELDPGSSQARSGLARALAGAKVQEIATHRSQASRKEDLEDWPSAAQEYEAVLALDPAIRFAQIGLERARDRASLHERLEYHLANPGRLASPEVHESTTDLLAEAQAVDSPGALLTDQITRLTEQLQVAATPVTVWLESDNLTRVVVYRVGDLGKFQRRSVDLRPGIYTVVGTRDGYRDVRLRLEVVPGRATQPLAVRCKEAI